jgi:hypothetical protein
MQEIFTVKALCLASDTVLCSKADSQGMCHSESSTRMQTHHSFPGDRLLNWRSTVSCWLLSRTIHTPCHTNPHTHVMQQDFAGLLCKAVTYSCRMQSWHSATAGAEVNKQKQM